jgi:hypothetical protein
MEERALLRAERKAMPSSSCQADRSRRVVHGITAKSHVLVCVGSLGDRRSSVMKGATIDHRTRTASPAAGHLTRPRQAEDT